MPNRTLPTGRWAARTNSRYGSCAKRGHRCQYEALLPANEPDYKAKAAAGEVAKTKELVTKDGLLELGAQLQVGLNKRVAESAKRSAEVDKALAIVKSSVFSGGSIVLALLLKLVVFP